MNRYNNRTLFVWWPKGLRYSLTIMFLLIREYLKTLTSQLKILNLKIHNKFYHHQEEHNRIIVLSTVMEAHKQLKRFKSCLKTLTYHRRGHNLIDEISLHVWTSLNKNLIKEKTLINCQMSCKTQTLRCSLKPEQWKLGLRRQRELKRQCKKTLRPTSQASLISKTTLFKSS